MSTLALLGIGAGSIALLLLLIIRWQVHAFVAMMLVSFLVAFATGMPIGDIISTLIAGMGGTLGSVAILVALGSMLGRMIEVSGGAASLANRFTQLLGPTRVPMALTAAALVLAIPVFFDVGFIILVPIVYGFCKAAGVNPIKFGLPVAGIMLAAHVVVPAMMRASGIRISAMMVPTPGALRALDAVLSSLLPKAANCSAVVGSMG